MADALRSCGQAVLSELDEDQLRPGFELVDSVLHRFQGLWRIQPMSDICGRDTDSQNLALSSILTAALPQAPETVASLVDAVGTLTLQQIEHIDASAEAQQALFAPLLPETLGLNWLVRPLENTSRQPPVPFWLSNGISGRKLSQIEAFITHTPSLAGTAAEWCAGKGHLGRLLSFKSLTQQHAPLRVISLEWQSSLCQSGEQLAHKFALAQSFQQTDVLSESAAQVLASCDHAVALHACGDLHRSLLEQASQAQLQSVWVAPCCYHLTAQTSYRPLSKVATESGLAISREELKLAVQGQVTAGERIRTLRETEVTWRLAYQLLRERYTNASDYRALPSVPKHWFSGTLEDFAEWACQHHDWSLPGDVDWSSILTQAGQRYLLLKRLDLIRHVFRRPLELWLALDRALFMQEQGYQVTLRAFCDYQTTPRNLLICATR